jgi:hypothetical protein
MNSTIPILILVSHHLTKPWYKERWHPVDWLCCLRLTGVVNAFQALALDEQRATFAPSVWKLDPKNQTTNLVQAWFPGAHINIGGGSREKDENGLLGTKEQLAYISYVWMLDRIRPYLALHEYELESQQAEISATLRSMEPAPPPQGLVQNISHFVKRKVTGARDHVYGYAGGMIDDSHTLLYDLIAFPKPRDPVHLLPTEVGIRTGEVVHPSVFYRQESELRLGIPLKDIYEPLAMKGWKREVSPGQTARWVKYDPISGDMIKWMPEFEIGHMSEKDSLERWLLEKSWCEPVREEVKEAWKSV